MSRNFETETDTETLFSICEVFEKHICIILYNICLLLLVLVFFSNRMGEISKKKTEFPTSVLNSKIINFFNQLGHENFTAVQVY